MLLFIAAVVCAGFCAAIARAKHRDGFGWFILGFLFSLIALIAIAAMPALTPQEKKAVVRKTPPKWEKAIVASAAVFAIVFFVGLTAAALYS